MRPGRHDEAIEPVVHENHLDRAVRVGLRQLGVVRRDVVLRQEGGDNGLLRALGIRRGAFAGVGIGLSAMFQGRAAAAACDAQAETGQGLANYVIALGVGETVASFVMVFTIIALGKVA